MRRVITVLSLLIASATWNAHAQTLNCEAAYTRVEKAICGSTRLSSLHNQLSETADKSVEKGVVSANAVVVLKDRVARVCRSANNLEHCLSEELSDVLELLSSLPTMDAVSTNHSKSESTQLAMLQRRLVEAEKRFHGGATPDEMVVTLLAMQQAYSELSKVSDTAEYESLAISAKLLAGCEDLGIRRQWNKALQAYGRACPINQIANADY